MSALQTILVVDDDDFMRMLLEDALSDHFRVITAASGEEALIRVRDDLPGVILLDIEMADGIDGYETCRRLKSGGLGASVPVIFVSGHEGEEARRKGIEAGGVDFVVKPFNPPEVVSRVLAALASPGR